MHRSALALLALTGLSAVLPQMGAAQKPPKIDSLVIQVPQPKAQAMDAVLEAFALAGLQITDNSGSLVEADDAGTTVSGFSGVKYSRVVRALVIGRDTSTSVLLTALETRTTDRSSHQKQVRISNRTGGNGEKVWRKMVAVAMALDSTQVPAAAIKPEKAS